MLRHLLFASTPFIPFLQLLTRPRPPLFAFCPPAIRAPRCPGTRQLRDCPSLPSGRASRRPNALITAHLSQLPILSCRLRTYKTKAIKKPKQIYSPRQTKNKMKIPCPKQGTTTHACPSRGENVKQRGQRFAAQFSAALARAEAIRR